MTNEELWNELEWAEPTIAPESWKEYAGWTVHHGHLWALNKEGERTPIGGTILCKPGEEITEKQKENLFLSLRDFIKEEQATILKP